MRLTFNLLDELQLVQDTCFWWESLGSFSWWSLFPVLHVNQTPFLFLLLTVLLDNTHTFTIIFNHLYLAWIVVVWVEVESQWLHLVYLQLEDSLHLPSPLSDKELQESILARSFSSGGDSWTTEDLIDLEVASFMPSNGENDKIKTLDGIKLVSLCITEQMFRHDSMRFKLYTW